MSFLKGKRCYLSGPMENSTESSWTEDASYVLSQEFGVEVLNPFDDPKQQWQKNLRELREKGNSISRYAVVPEIDHEIERIAHGFVRKDLKWVSQSDFLIACLPKGVATTGTHNEIVNSVNNKNPTLIFCPEGRYFVPFWYWGMSTKRFGSLEAVWDYLEEVDSGKHKKDDRWSFVYGLV